MSLSMLPEAIYTAYGRYKAYESSILHWIVLTSNAYSYRGPTAPNSSKKSSHNKSDSTSTIHLDDPSKPTKYTVPYHEIVDRVKFIITAQKHRRSVPDYIIEYLKKSIADRGKCTAWFCKHKVGDILVSNSRNNKPPNHNVLQVPRHAIKLPISMVRIC